MPKLTKKQRYNRAIIVLVAGIFVTAWVMFNSMEWSMGAILYIILGVLGIFLYLNWNKIKPWS